ncbi:NAD(P)H dehydrogenase (quinone) [Microbacterium sp. ru370.1]|uniref:SDR family oxidoreductase n=1 Tax=unclassified Microbacterium TaxID=2609290 RepID=UPI00087E7434|nr:MULTISPECIES: SDR family oxidoreductase [unclassified Microbacterium]SDO61550.1 NAD(P)H dehydrogenase (quinone) [Microbacterium sp. ru370.1]SIT86470.1 NAD(P)H dehydrogenase (quinone) [Microbacterium sp. RU1D]
MTLLVTAASGHLGRLVVDALLERGVAASDIVAGVRTPSKVDDLAARGVGVVELDYSRPDTLAPALEGVERVLLISGTDADRVAGHRNVIEAARAAGVERLVYTSAPRVDEIDYALGADHKATEEAIAASGLSATVLRHNWYTENYLDAVARAAQTGEIVAAVGDARVASASRRDYAEAAALALTTDELAGRTLEVGGDVAWTYDDLAAAASEVLGRPVIYTSVTLAQLEDGLKAAGLDAGTAAFIAGTDDAIARGALSQTDGTLSALLGRPTTPLVEGLREGLAV